MCGIVGYIGQSPVVPVLIDGLRRLEYRGYDSAGVAVVRDGQIALRRSVGKLARLQESLETDPLDGEYGIGHTRWATHGCPTEENAHPHRDCTGRVVVVHNGIIENYLDLKHELTARGHRIVTETDTEMVAHLVEQEMRGDGLDQAVRRTLARLRGSYALVIISADAPDTIVAATNGPPLVVGIGNGEFVVASDTPAILSRTREVVFLRDEEMAVIRRDRIAFTSFAGAPLSKPTEHVLWDPITAEKAGYRHFMLKEIFEQPRAVADTIRGRISAEAGQVYLEEMKLSAADLRGIEKIQIVACGTSWHASLVGRYLIERLAHVPVDVDYGSEYRYRGPIADRNTLAIVITQSGETADTLAALREARSKGARSVAICNVVGAMATREAEGTVYTHAGLEIGVASTKAFTSQLVALNLLALALAEARGTLSADEARGHIDALLQLPHQMEHVLKASAPMEDVASRLFGRSDFLYLGRGINYPIALEGALKLKEISYIHAEGYPAGEMKHGPIALIDGEMPVVALVPHDRVFEKMIGNVLEVKARGGSVIAITTGGHDLLKRVLDPDRDFVLTLPSVHPLLTPVTLVLPLQLLAYHVAVKRGCDVDQPRNLAKSVTVE